MTRNNAEFRLTVAVADLLRFTAKPDVYWTHLPFGEARSERTGARLKRMGTVPGAADFLIVTGGRPVFLELKAEKGRQNEAQRATQDKFTVAGGLYHCAKGYAAAHDFLDMIGVLRVARDDRFAPRQPAEAA